MLIFKSQDDILWIKITKSVLNLTNDLYICLCYVIPDESSRQALTENNIFDRLLDSVVFVENKADNNFHLLICGDFNGRSSINPDFVSDDDTAHIDVLPDEYSPDGYMHTVDPRYLGIMIPLGGFSHCINIGVLLFRRIWY